MATIEKVIPFNKISLKSEVIVDKINYNGIELELRKPTTKDIYDLIMITLQKADVGGVYNPFLLDVYFHLNLIYAYTKINFSDDDREDEFELYDKLNNSGLMQMVIDAIPEYSKLQRFVEDTVNAQSKYRSTIASAISQAITEIPQSMETAMEIVNNFDPSKWQAVQDFARAANGGRDIPGITTSNSSDKTE